MKRLEVFLQASLLVATGIGAVNIYQNDSQRSAQIEGEALIEGSGECPVTGEKIFDDPLGKTRILGGGYPGIFERLDEIASGHDRPKIISLGNGKYVISPITEELSIDDPPITVKSKNNTYTIQSIPGPSDKTRIKVIVSFPC